jgi:hypothetical protein
MRHIWASDPQFNAITTLSVLRTAFCWVITQQAVVISYRRFGTACRSHLQGSIVLISCHLSEGRKVKPGTFFLLPELLHLLLLTWLSLSTNLPLFLMSIFLLLTVSVQGFITNRVCRILNKTTWKERSSTICLHFSVRLIPVSPGSYRNSSAQIVTN